MQTAVYVRLSQDRSGEGLGVTRQLEDCGNLANELGWSVAEIYRDNDISATSGKTRPGYERMLADIENGRASAIIAWHPDRLYRRMADLEQLITVVEQHDVAIRTVRYGDFDLATPTGRMIARILGSVATGEVEVKADRWKRAWRQKREAGAMPGGQRLYGYNGSEVVEAEAAIVRELAAKVLAGASLNGLATDLNTRSIVTANGNPWNATRVRRVLLNPRLAGHATLKGEIVGEGNWDPIIDDATWRSIRALLSARNRPGAPRVALLAGLALCGRCGQPLHSGRRTDGARRLRCINAPRKPGCGKLVVLAEPVEEIVEGVARTYLSHEKIRKAVAAAQAGGQTHILAELEQQQRRLEEIKHAIAGGSKNVVLLDQAADIVRQRVADLEAQLSVSVPAKIPDDVTLDWPTGLGERRRLVELVIARVTVAPAKVKGAPFDPDRVDFIPTDLITGAGS